MRSLIREPLVHFLLIGAILFAVFELFDDPAGSDSDRIVITRGQVEFLKANFSRTWLRPPGDKELQGLVDGFIEEEILYREALALGLDKNDPIIRRRLGQKVELMSSELAEALTQSEEKLQQYLADHPQKFRISPQLSFTHIFFNPQKRGMALENDAAVLLKELSGTDRIDDPALYGDRILIPSEFNMIAIDEVNRLFGKRFSTSIEALEPGTWIGPVRSGYGYHLVFISEKSEGRLPDLSEIRPQVERELMAAEKKRLSKEFMETLRKNYTVEIEWPDTPETEAQ